MTDHSIKVLLVEDNELDARMVARSLRSSTFTDSLEVVSDGDAALRRLRESEVDGGRPQPDLVLLDLNLPGLSGHEILEEIKSDPALRHIPVVVLTSSSAESDIAEAYSRHAAAFITKPVGADGFLDVIQAIERLWFDVATRVTP